MQENTLITSLSPSFPNKMMQQVTSANIYGDTKKGKALSPGTVRTVPEAKTSGNRDQCKHQEKKLWCKIGTDISLGSIGVAIKHNINIIGMQERKQAYWDTVSHFKRQYFYLRFYSRSQ